MMRMDQGFFVLSDSIASVIYMFYWSNPIYTAYRLNDLNGQFKSDPPRLVTLFENCI